MKQISFYMLALILVVSACSESESNVPDVKMMTIKSSKKHLAKAQIYRWYQLYERELSDVRIDNTLDMLTDDIVVKSAAGEARGKDEYKERLSAFEGWKNAHHVDNIEVQLGDEGTILLETDIRYQNIRPNGDKFSYSLHYNTKLIEDGHNLPDFTSIEIQPTGETNETFVDAYPENRTKSLMHYWLANMERLDGNVTPFKELLAPGFELNFSTSTALTSIDELETWLNGVPTQLKESSHIPKDFSVKTIVENEYEVTVFFDWQGVTKEGTRLKATTKHIWYVVDDVNDRFAKILKADVTQIIPIEEVE
ncbi:nuclear transport factor 2 family protein [Aquimarina sp. RZ0]|uniref:nuclear transport factor 2 family protein n=1 Tax=Aquimarina sp. RZ0 TaxID=2607730 RepID=UPI0011F1996C|nr:nuclear transport factor 2 family protein [Aquimarina sp. RZ0]KAA1245578.1 nuclear transport factor 2 family protein [Aquimarina sp. RZ0]